MKVVSSNQMSEIESLAYRSGFSETDFMEEAGSGVALIVHDYVEKNELDRTVILLCGKGNNGGDAYVAGIHLIHLEYDVFAIHLTPIEECSNLCKQHYERFMAEGGRVAETLLPFPKNGIIIDGLFGTGFHGAPTEKYAEVIKEANVSGLPIISVDIPSGLNGETGEVLGEAIIATETAFLGLPKTGFFIRDGWNHVGKLRFVDFGLPQEHIDECDSELVMLDPYNIKPLMPLIKYGRHKYEAGYVVGLSGSPGMPGAAILSSSAALKSGAGIVRLYFPDGMQTELASSPPELIRIPYNYAEPKPIIEQMNKANAVFIGPGLGTTQETKNLLKSILPQIVKPCVLDADALNILATEEIKLPKQTIFTPHVGEMMRLLHLDKRPIIDLDFLNACKQYAAKKKITLILKGAPTFILSEGQPILINSTGNPGMATAGSGDVLTGMVASFLAQGCSLQNSASLAVFLHGLAGEHAAEEMTPYCMVASDIIFHFPEAFKFYMV